MKNELIPLLHRLGIVEAIWLYTNQGNKILTILRHSHYQKWAFVNNELKGFTVTLGENGAIKNYSGNIIRWSIYKGE